ncbi:glycosyltransferase family 2 protein [Thorsellia kenyensis]|uniref:Glycosyltransferase family 2 protein n=1 Tax=Thorsellia kenyensis TaxID=1549888 RepID=A0ABV6CEC0_9GAMM
MNVFIVIVTFNSTIDKLNEIVLSCYSLGNFIIVDNSTILEVSNKIEDLCSSFNLNYISMNGNKGIASAQNVGVQFAIENGAQELLFLDDDSLPQKDMLKKLIYYKNLLIDSGFVDPIVCPNPIDSNGNDLLKSGKLITEGIYEIRDLISSGTLVSTNTFKKIGFYDESLFIDCVDYEWGWRAKNIGFCIFLVKSAILNHRQGEYTIKYINLRLSSPIRHYYQFRNILFMISKPYAPLAWKLKNLIKLPFKLFFLLCFADQKIKRISYSLKGIIDYLRRKTGKI